MKSSIFLIISIFCLLSAGSAFGGGDPAAGETKSAPCKACHGDAGISSAPTFPNIAGQHKDYLYQALLSYKNGDRKNAIMSGMVSSLSKQDMKDLAAYYSAQSGLFSIDALH